MVRGFVVYGGGSSSGQASQNFAKPAPKNVKRIMMMTSQTLPALVLGGLGGRAGHEREVRPALAGLAGLRRSAVQLAPTAVRAVRVAVRLVATLRGHAGPPKTERASSSLMSVVPCSPPSRDDRECEER